MLTSKLAADSTAWNACTAACGGTMCPRSLSDEHVTLRLDGDLLHTTVVNGLPLIPEAPRDELRAVRSSAFTARRQIAMPQYHETLDALSPPADRCVPAGAGHGDHAAAPPPLQLAEARGSRTPRSGGHRGDARFGRRPQLRPDPDPLVRQT
ncbi:hypothetical protein RND61_09905 [Streptomyces sp. TRM76323]|uniref:Uncharacterized protein n=1 Tax=Streptomyces tamarix TaxID=3078565 RepID=A0ABU3QHZ6_9ACTN|nr:hypothetical protein [Streptomyces tamarix]MDT9682381.1 hypothetical protein [Streptomyces tamarix]